MGTRNLTAVMIDGEYKIAQYGQLDGYPSGQGITALNILRNQIMRTPLDADEFKRKVRATRFATDDETEGKTISDFPQMSRDHGAKILEIVNQAQEGMILQNSIGFAADSVMCEFAYVIDFDKGTFEVFEGFNQMPLAKEERFHAVPNAEKSNYQPVKFMHSWPLDQLPADEEFLETLEPDEEAE